MKAKSTFSWAIIVTLLITCFGLTATPTAGPLKANAKEVTADEDDTSDFIDTSGIVLKVGEKRTIKAAIPVICASQDDSIVTINQSGVATAKKVGGTYLIFTSKANPNRVNYLPVDVIPDPDSLTFTGPSTAKTLKKVTLKTNLSCTFTVTNKSLIKVNKTAKKSITFTGQKAGTIKITAKAKTGNQSVTKTFKITKTKLTATLNKKKVKTFNTIKLKANIPCTFKSSNKKIATINSSGKITGKKKGTVKVTATSKNDGQKKTYKVTVQKNKCHEALAFAYKDYAKIKKLAAKYSLHEYAPMWRELENKDKERQFLVVHFYFRHGKYKIEITTIYSRSWYDAYRRKLDKPQYYFLYDYLTVWKNDKAAGGGLLGYETKKELANEVFKKYGA